MKSVEKKWIKKWQEAKIFEAEPDKSKKKFFGTFPYPYVNSYLHLGHFYSSMRLEAFSRYKRMQGFNVLYAQGWHCTGSPIVSAAKRVVDNEPKQIEILKKQGFSDKEIKNFKDPVEWIKYFPKEARKDFTDMGYSIDFRREFITTSLNPHYDKFIRWQFNILKEKCYVKKGKFPVVWDPVDNTPVGDHDRIEGEGEVPQEYVLVKHRLQDKYVVTATLRPDTILGVTNLYVNPMSELVEAQVGNEVWIISERVAKDLNFQDKKVSVIRKINGWDLIGKKVHEFSGQNVMILPAAFVNIWVGTGIVHSVPSDSADDLIALYDLQKDEEQIKKCNINIEEVRLIKPIPVLEIPGYGKIPADDIIKKLGIKNQHDKQKLEQAKELLYKDGFYKGKLNHLYAKRFSEDLSGKNVSAVKEQIKKELVESEFGDIYYQLTGRVVARSLAECVVKIVDDQWFMAYGDSDWKKKAHKCLDNMQLFPEKTRSQFDYVLDWLRDWACTREFGLGTRLPWDDKWLIESLSDSTIYMAYYTIVHKLKEIPIEKIDDNFFDYVFLGKDKSIKVSKKLADELRQEFEYWYPMDFRNTGKDLIQNHMSFCIFNHTAVFPEKYWPRSFGLNGHVTVDGIKMSKSRGNFILMREAHEEYGADASRFAMLSGGEGIDDANFDRELVKSLNTKLQALLDFANEYYDKGRPTKLSIDKWMDQKIDSVIAETTRCYEDTLFRSALQSSYFELQNSLKWYMKRTLNNPNKAIIKRFIEVQALLLAPVTPFICEEIWEKIGKEGFISQTKWPVFSKSAAEPDRTEDIVKNTLEDITSVVTLLKIKKAGRIKLFIAEPWKYRLLNLLRKEVETTRDFSKLMATAMKDETFRKNSKDVTAIIQKFLKNPIKDILDHDMELDALKQSSEFFRKEFDCHIEILKAEDSLEQKSRQAMPGKPAILIN
jgi:leucyl-tRNA synthetase